MKDSTLIFVCEGPKIIDIDLPELTGSDAPLDGLDLEIYRIFQEYKALKLEVKQLKERLGEKPRKSCFGM